MRLVIPNFTGRVFTTLFHASCMELSNPHAAGQLSSRRGLFFQKATRKSFQTFYRPTSFTKGLGSPFPQLCLVRLKSGLSKRTSVCPPTDKSWNWTPAMPPILLHKHTHKPYHNIMRRGRLFQKGMKINDPVHNPQRFKSITSPLLGDKLSIHSGSFPAFPGPHKDNRGVTNHMVASRLGLKAPSPHCPLTRELAA